MCNHTAFRNKHEGVPGYATGQACPDCGAVCLGRFVTNRDSGERFEIDNTWEPRHSCYTAPSFCFSEEEVQWNP